MKRRTYQVTRVTKKIDHRLRKLEAKLKKLNKLVLFIENNLGKQGDHSKVKNKPGITYTISVKKD